MEETVCTVADSFVTVYTSRTDDADRRFGSFHHTGLYGRSMSTEYYIRMSFDEKCVLHIACRMIFGKVQCREYMPVVFDFRTFGDAESQTCEDINDFVLYNCNRMTCTEFNRISRAGQVKTVATIILALELFLQRIDFVLRFSFQFIQSHADFFFLFGSYVTEIRH